MPARNRRLPQHLSWPLTSTDICSALGETPSHALQLSFFDHHWTDGTLLKARWVPPTSSNYGAGLPSDRWSSVWITVAPIPGSERAAARQILREQALPELRNWVEKARNGSEAWALSRHSIAWRYVNRFLHLSHDQQPYQPVKLP
ncbi:hypothetical protein GCM10018781_64310 [Kitasatospora indigofera]|uniref:Uncharacterized protein n=1 Tax=Kitasatospora indigofera TaxID=67307 RepID=A0A919GBQ7_9ACTN|nr:hypothetical protein [Kitasatospora indigofera]GHH81514.1 hypothetical protein GCM10018781_64310 [Kitasatospora indigofera]